MATGGAGALGSATFRIDGIDFLSSLHPPATRVSSFCCFYTFLAVFVTVVFLTAVMEWPPCL